MGLRSKPTYRVVAIDSRRARDGKYLEAVGSYDPRSKKLDLELERVSYWLSQGALPSDTVSKLITRYQKQHPPAVAAEPVASTEPVAPVEAEPAPAPEPTPTTTEETPS